MSETQRVSRSRAKPDRADARGGDAHAGSAGHAPAPAPAWAANHVAAPFALGGVQRKVTIGPAGDAYEREADRVSSDVASGRTIAPSAISPIGSLGAVGQRTTASGKKPEQDRKPESDRKPEAEKKKKEDPLSALPLQKASAAPAKDDAKKSAKPADKKKEEKPAAAAVQKADDKKKEEKPKPAAPVQKAAAPAAAGDMKKEEPKKDGKKVQKAAAPAASSDPKKQEPKKDDAKKVQKAADDKKKDEKPKPAMAVQKAAAPAGAGEMKKEEKKEDAKKVQKAADDKKKDEKPKTTAPVQKAPTPEVQAPGAPKEKDKKKEPEKTTEQKLADAPVRRAPALPVDDAIREAERDAERDLKRPTAEDDVPVQRAANDSPTRSMESAASRAVATKGAGEPMQSSTRDALESRMGVDLGGVRVHEDRAAQESSRAIQAKAFTHGNDIWLGPGESQSNLPLMAHEATHVVQQAGGVHRMLVQRADKKGKNDKASGTVDLAAKTVEIDELHIPRIKGKFPPTAPYQFKKPQERTNQRQIWREKLVSDVGAALPNKLKPLPAISMAEEGAMEAKPDDKSKAYFLQMSKGDGHAAYVIGTADQLKEEFVIPRWGRGGDPSPMDVDHKRELQLGGDASELDNFWLLHASSNRSSGAKISNEIQKAVTAATASETEAPVKKGKGAKAKNDSPDAAATPKQWKVPPTLNELLDAGFTVTAKSINADLDVKEGGKDYWDVGEIKAIDEPLKQLKPLTAKQAVSRDLVGDKKELVIYPLPTGGRPRKVKLNPKKDKDPQPFNGEVFTGFEATTVTYDVDAGTGSISGIVFPGKRAKRKIGPQAMPKTMKLVNLGGLPYTTTIAPGELGQSLKFATLKGLSPIEFSEVTVAEPAGLVARGKLMPSVPFFKKLDLDILITGEDVSLSKTFTKDDFNLPGPLKVTAANLTIALGTSEASVSGNVFFEIERVGRGSLTGSLGKEGIEVEGSFDFDSEIFDPARVTVGYKDGTFSGKGEIGIPEGRVKGIKSASLTASFEGERIEATGSVKPAIPGIEQGDLKFAYDPKTGVVIGGRLELKKDIPGLEGGSVQAELSKPAGADKWKVKASGEATPKIPGVSSTLAVSYDDGAFDAIVVAGYDKGMLKGQITVAATNRPIGDDGKPSGPPPEKGEKITIFGGGSVTLRIAPWLQATAGIRLLPNGEIEVTGEIGLPAALELFKEKKFDKNIFKIGIDIPIVGVSVLGKRIGIFANITGGLDLSAGIGPGELNQLKLAVTYNPAHEEETKVSGDANLHIPAHAGLRFFVRGSLGIGIPIVSASAGLEIGAMLGLEGALDAGVHVDWSPSKGLDLTAQASVYVEPKFKFDITGFVLVEADLWIKTIELYSKRWELAAFEYGSGLRFGLKFPIHYVEGQPFDVSLSDIQFEVPQIEPGSLLKGLIKQIA